MKKNIFLLIVGLVIGFFIYPKLHSEVPINIMLEDKTAQRLPEQNPPGTSSSSMMVKKSLLETSPSHASPSPVPKELLSEQKKPVTVKMRLDKFLNIHLEEPIIDKLELARCFVALLSYLQR